MSEAAMRDFAYRYRFASGVRDVAGMTGLRLATFGTAALQDDAHPCFFDGQIARPSIVADTLLALSQVVRTHFYLPQPPMTDPVVTCNDEVLRFEGFSGCCGVYVRVDFDSAAFDVPFLRRGTTNVDFNNELRVGLSKLRQSRVARLAVGARELSLQVDESEIVEKKVKLPLRWIKSFSEVQAYLPKLRLMLEVSGSEFVRFLRGLPRGAAKNQPAWVVSAGRGLRLSQREQTDGVRVLATDRLRGLELLAAEATSIRAWSGDAGVSAWEVRLESARYWLVLSPELHRGFSGEGQLLTTLSREDWQNVVDQVRAQLSWQARVDAAEVAHRCRLPEAEVNAALAVQGTQGAVGYDLAEGRYFHRELPFAFSRIENQQPRLKAARKLIEGQQVRLHQRLDAENVELLVRGSEVEHLVRLSPQQDRCSCPWYGKHQGERGPCKHVLAARLFVENSINRSTEQ
jgi:hypothetical protein